MPIDFKRMHEDGLVQTLRDAQDYRMRRDMLKELAKYLPMRIPFVKWKKIDTEMDEEPNTKLIDIFQRVVQYDFPWNIDLLPAPAIKPGQLLINDQLRSTPLWTLMGRLAQSVEKPAVVLFHHHHRGLWVMHNMTPPTTGLYVCVPAQSVGLSNIIIEPMNTWAERNFGDA